MKIYILQRKSERKKRKREKYIGDFRENLLGDR